MKPKKFRLNLNKMRYRLTIVLYFIFLTLYSQEVKIKLAGKEYNVCTSLAYAAHLKPDSVQGFSLQSKGYKDFPMEILNIKILQSSI